MYLFRYTLAWDCFLTFSFSYWLHNVFACKRLQRALDFNALCSSRKIHCWSVEVYSIFFKAKKECAFALQVKFCSLRIMVVTGREYSASARRKFDENELTALCEISLILHLPTLLMQLHHSAAYSYVLGRRTCLLIQLEKLKNTLGVLCFCALAGFK